MITVLGWEGRPWAELRKPWNNDFTTKIDQPAKTPFVNRVEQLAPLHYFKATLNFPAYCNVFSIKSASSLNLV